MMSEPFEHIDDYKKGLLSESDKAIFEAAMADNATLQLAVDQYDLAKEISLSFLDEEVRSVLNEEDGGQKQITYKKNKLTLVWIMTVIIVLMALMYYFYSMAKTNTTKIQYADIYVSPSWPINRGASQDSLSDAINVALGGNLKSAILMLKKLNLPREEKNRWVAELFAKDSQADSTLYYLPDTSSDLIIKDRIHYLRIISLYQQGKMDEVKREIQALPPDTDRSYIKIYDQIRK